MNQSQREIFFKGVATPKVNYQKAMELFKAYLITENEGNPLFPITDEKINLLYKKAIEFCTA